MANLFYLFFHETLIIDKESKFYVLNLKQHIVKG